MLTYAIVAGILFGLYFSLVGIGLNLVFGVMRIVNLAHGDFLMLGGYVAFWLYTLTGIDPLYAVLISLVVFLIVGLVLYPLLVPRLQKSKDPEILSIIVIFLLVGVLLYGVLVPRLQGSANPEMLSIILFFGLSQVIEACVTIAFGTSERSIPSVELGSSVFAALGKMFGTDPDPGPVSVLGQSFPSPWVVSAVVSVIAIGLVYIYLYRTRLGTLTRAVMSRRDEALASGINVDRVSAAAFGIGFALAAIAGVFTPFMFGSITPAFGIDATVTSFVVVVLGSLGNPLGTAIGGIVYGVSYMLVQTYLSSWADLLPYVLLIAILLLRPSGLLGRQVRVA
jgi:branched-chain amino acid transport system permease protein